MGIYIIELIVIYLKKLEININKELKGNDIV
jgi:hypothetical protein